MNIIYNFVLGLLLAPILNSIAMHWDSRFKPAIPLSYCTSSHGANRYLSFIPFISFFSKSKNCPTCGNATWWRYGAAEPITALLFAYSAYWIGTELELIAALLLISVLAVIVQTDLTCQIIPNKVVFPAIACAMVVRLFIHPLPLWQYGAGALAGSGALLLIGLLAGKLLKKEAMGGGDIKLYVFIGLILGAKLTLFSLFAASVFGLLGGVITIFAGKYSKGNTIPFGPYIAAGALASYWWGDLALEAYLSFAGLSGP
ncbi:prepilin peptidase [Paenibacillus sp. GCM10027627]|uniref:prepilin peptidase n=1 Tax=unclassified Paenibacillus TaxID=185978 RepID=UPI0036288895